jgi:nitrous oxidase accessory protein NosD
VRDCTVSGAIVVHGGSDVEIAWNDVRRGNIAALGSERISVTGNRQSDHRWGTGIDVVGGCDHRIDANETDGDLCGIRVRETEDALVTGNRCTTRWWGIHLDRATGTEAAGNRLVRTMRAVNVTGGADNRVSANVAEHCDTGVLVERGASATSIGSNRIDGCRVGILLWADDDTAVGPNTVTGSRDHDRVTGP